MFKEFKEFVNQGNALDLAVGVIIGAAFGKIVNSLVNDIITPLLGLITGGVDFKDRFIMLAGTAADGLEATRLIKGNVVLAYGAFLNTIIEFFLIAFSIFLVIRQINKFRAPKKA